MNSISIRHLKQSLQHFFEHYDAQKEETVYAKFSTNLFTENRQKTAFYFQQIEQTFACLEQVEAGNLEALQFYSQKLSAQCTALSDALTRQQQNDQPFPRKTKEEEPEPADKRRHPVHRLPPRERLAKYYDYLASFNEKIQLVQDALEKAQHERQLVNKQTLKQLEQRRARCLEAIDVLEEYLVFMEKQK
ncbi:primosomal replication protein [Aggregatibacter actinomycetemcomitans]|uniref:primosomal replication protein PriC n=1 Tax=Aggregatibacter actinomycetemcomitans TaxID=714 RepID=UPI00197BBA22|nr:primosomal replication protein PriC [Aggregatibacter actinomycetemcomitans]MBN6078074.1 primosomal replication protein [Aggregatibacter actinomycetemcomitans]